MEIKDLTTDLDLQRGEDTIRIINRISKNNRK